MVTYSKEIETYFYDYPYPYYEQLRASSDQLFTTFNGHEGWFITNYQKSIELLKDRRFQSEVPTPKTSIAKLQKQMVLFKNGADHSRLRSVIMNAFTKDMSINIRSFVEETTQMLLEYLQDKEEIEIISDYAFPLSAAVIARILGVPIDSYHELRKWSNLLVQTIDFSRNQTNLRAGRQVLIEIRSFFQPILDEKLKNPQDDVISKLSKHLMKDETLSFEELLANCILLLIAGQETTVNLISTGILLLIKHQDQLQILRENEYLIESAIEEVLRFESPTQLTARVACEDIIFHGDFIRKGDRVFVLIGAANRDPVQFQHANVFDITRMNNRHLAFGYGEHFCIGATLARIEGQIAIKRFFQQFPQVQLSNKNIKWRELVGFRALKELYCIIK